MKKYWPALAAVLIFAAVAVIDTLAIIPYDQRGNFETLSNVFMIGVAVMGFFQRRQSSHTDESSDYGSIFSNVMVSIITFPMNIIVFGHVIRPEQFLSDLWCWHLFWIGCGIVQFFGLSAVGKGLVSQVLAFLRWVIEIVRQFGNMISGVLNFIQNSDKSVFLTVFIGIIGLLADVGIQVYTRGLSSVFADTNFLVERIFWWVIFGVIMLFVIHTIPLALRKVKEAIRSVSGKIVMAVMAVVILAVLTGVMPFLLQAIAFIIMIPAIAMGVLWLVIKGICRLWKKIYGIQEKNENASVGESIARDWVIVIIAYVGIPILILCFITVNGSGGKEIIATQDPSELTTWLNFIKEALEVAKNLLELFAI